MKLPATLLLVNLRRAGANARPEIGQWLSQDGPETGHRLDRARRGEDGGGRVRLQTRSRRAVFRSDPWPHSGCGLPLLFGRSGRKKPLAAEREDQDYESGTDVRAARCLRLLQSGI